MVRIMKKDGNRLEGIGERITVRLTLLEEALGMTPGDPEIYGNWIASKAPEPEVGEEEVGVIEGMDAVEDATTCFPRTEDGVPFCWDYQIKGFFKDACSSLRRVPGTRSSKLTAFKKVIDEAKDRAKSSSDVWLARMADYDAWLDAQETVGAAYNVKNVATAVELILKIFQRNVTQCSEGWVETTDNKRYVPIETVIGKTKIPAEDAKVIKKALDTMVGSGQLDAKALYSGITQLCQQYLDSK